MDSYQPIYDAVRSRISSCDPGAAFAEAANLQMGGFSYLPQHIQQEVYRVSGAMTAPHVLMRPAIYPDGNQWCALYGEDLVRGVSGFGDTPAAAMAAFDTAWLTDKIPALRTTEQHSPAQQKKED